MATALSPTIDNDNRNGECELRRQGDVGSTSMQRYPCLAPGPCFSVFDALRELL